MIESSLLTSLACLLLAGPAPIQDEAPPATPRAAKEAIDAGDYQRAHALVTELLVEQRLGRAAAEQAAGRPVEAWEELQLAIALAPHSPSARELRAELRAPLLERWLGEARAELLEGDPRDAMIPLDNAFALAPDDAAVNFLRGECSLRMGLQDGNVFAFHDARQSFLAAAGSRGMPEAWSGAARALFLIYFDSGASADLDRALELARRGRAESPEESAWTVLMQSPPLRTWAEIAFQAFTVAFLDGQAPDQTAERFDESRAALEAMIGRTPEDPWPWRQLANLLAWESRHEEAAELLLRALEIAPGEAALHEQLVAATGNLGGAARTLETYTSWVAANPEVGLGHWWLGVKHLDHAIERLHAGDLEVEAQLETAEAAFARCAELMPDYIEACGGYRALCRAAVGRSRLERGDVPSAEEAFRSMEERVEGGLLWQYPDKLESGVIGLQRVVGHALRSVADDAVPEVERNAALERAADISIYLHEFLPEDPDIANNAGFLSRDAGVALQQRAELLLRRSAGLGQGAPASPEESARQRSEAEELLRRAHEHMERSYAAYTEAARLAPDDARIVNDRGLILTYYLQRDLETAESCLREAIATGEAQLAAGVEDEEARLELTEAVGDAYENMGVLLLTLHGDAAGSLPWFERSVEIGPIPRPIVQHRHLPLCRKVIAGEVDVETVKRAGYWGRLEPAQVLERIQADDELRRILREARE